MPDDLGGRAGSRERGSTDERFLAYTDLAARGIPFTRQHISRLIKQGRFPAPIKLGAGTNRWIASEVDAWFSQRIADREADLARRRGER
ncbi:AlpA family transcriptional regulator [uncultured Sphingomonas sp.]|uniref:helix-turn-helix transcriptional regulator n=1 Tax=uncultured Sphingomonas sp. TaxID=158754 RepID=UPI00262EB735|nr:AlpA family phage regulatory protein [uncultured Sphingomonas sp.]